MSHNRRVGSRKDIQSSAAEVVGNRRNKEVDTGAHPENATMGLVDLVELLAAEVGRQMTKPSLAVEGAKTQNTKS